MCLVITRFNPEAEWPVVLAANRDEYYDRPGMPPQVLAADPLVVGGLDLRAGGTWLGVNQYGLIVALTNLHGVVAEQARAMSRGNLVRAALRGRNVSEAVASVADLTSEADYNPFSLLVISVKEARLCYNYPQWSSRALTAGWHILGNYAADDPQDVRVRRASAMLSEVAGLSGYCLIDSLKLICSDHALPGGRGGGDTLCMHGLAAGTRSSSIICLNKLGNVAVYEHAEGPPCSVSYRPISVPWS